MITLKEFVRETLKEITEGLLEFKAMYEDKGFTGTPNFYATSEELSAVGFVRASVAGGSGNASVMPVTFDVAVTAEEISKAGGSGSLKVVSLLSAEGGMKTETINSTVSRVSFRIPLTLPAVVREVESPPEPRVYVDT